MESFIKSHVDSILGTLSGFDRVLFRGTLRSISYCEGMDRFLGAQHVLYKDFGTFVNGLSAQLKDHAAQVAHNLNRPYMYLHSPERRKEDIAKSIVERDHITDGLVCVLSCVEPCQSFEIRKDDKNPKLVKLVSTERKCLH